MSSILTNTSAMVALQTLRSINMNLEQSNNRVASGLRVANAADNAAYWSIATTLKSDNSSMAAVQDSLGIGASTLDTTYTGLEAAVDLLGQIKDKLTTATGEGVDRAKVQLEIKALQDQLKAAADSASSSGENWLSTGSSTSFNKSFVSSLSRDSNNQLVIGTIDVDITDVRLYGNGTTQFGIADKTIDLTFFTADSGTAATVETAAVDFAAADDEVTFTVSQNGGPNVSVYITQQTLTDAGLSGTEILSLNDLRDVLEQALADSGITGISVDFDASDNVVFSSTEDFDIGGASATGTSALDVTDLGLAATALTTSSASAGATSVADIDVSAATTTEIEGYINVVDEALSQVTDAASSIGAVQNRVESQLTFVKALVDANTRAISTLVDANMEEESTMLKALQTQQQLAVQALSIANSSAQNILVLFRN
jgi:flagellin